jgi:hypothetical protein
VGHLDRRRAPRHGRGPPAGLCGLLDRAEQHPTYDDHWRSLAIDTRALGAADVPVLGIGGWHDLFPKGMVDNFRAARDQSWLLMLPWAHGDFVPGQPEFPIVDRALLPWFDHWLLGPDGAPLPSARVTSWEQPKRAGRWTEMPDWPPAGAVSELHLNGDGGLAGTAGAPVPVSYTVNPFDNGCACQDHGLYGAPDDPANDQRIADQSRLHFDTAPVAADTVVAGEPVLRLRASLSAPDGNLVARLEDVAPDGASAVITTGWLRASHRLGHEHPVAVGHRLRLSLSSGDVQTIEPNAPPGTVSVSTGTGGSMLQLPVRR